MVLYKLVSNLSAMQISMTLFHIYLCLINHHLPVMAYFQPSMNADKERPIHRHIYECIYRGWVQAYDEHRAMRVSVGGVDVGLKGGCGCAQGHIMGCRHEHANGHQ